jgi:hypothetical protein
VNIVALDIIEDLPSADEVDLDFMVEKLRLATTLCDKDSNFIYIVEYWRYLTEILEYEDEIILLSFRKSLSKEIKKNYQFLRKHFKIVVHKSCSLCRTKGYKELVWDEKG